MNNNKVLSITATSWQSARQLARFLTWWRFRGQADATWELSSAMERAGQVHRLFPETWEAGFIYEIKRRAYQYIPHPPADNESLEWLSLLQHYGCPTRLLDFTHSFYIAAFFSVETAQADSAIWAVDRGKIDSSLNLKLGIKTSSNMNLSDINERNLRVVQGYIGQKKREHNLVVDVEPIHLTERASIQQSLFLFPLNAHATFMENLLSTFDVSREHFNEAMKNPLKSDEVNHKHIDSASLIKITLPKGCHGTTIFDLKEMNITAATLFPGLDGFARSLKIRFHYPIDDEWQKSMQDFISGFKQEKTP
jgi:hypothetical protein